MGWRVYALLLLRLGWTREEVDAMPRHIVDAVLAHLAGAE